MNDTLIVNESKNTGLRTGFDRIIEAAAKLVENGQITRSFQGLAEGRSGPP